MPHSSDPTGSETKIIEANVAFYRQVADRYESYESYLFDPFLQRSLEDDLDKIGSYFAGLGRAPSCLECGGGTGRLTLKMCARGWNVTVVDVSREMLALLEAKVLARGFSPALITAPIERFLAEANEQYDLVAFSAVLHHLYSYMSVVEQAASLLRPGGIFYSSYDPITSKESFWARAFDSLDIAIAKLLFDPTDLFPGIWRRLRRLFLRNDPEFGRVVFNAGDLAEFHVPTGVDDGKILQILREKGLSIVEHQRFATGRTKVVHSLNKRLRLSESFKIIGRRVFEH